MSTRRNVLLVILWKWSAVNMGINIWLFLVEQSRLVACIPNRTCACVCLLDVRTCQVSWMMIYITVHPSLMYQKAPDCYWTTIIRNHQSHICSAYLQSSSSGKWQINILFLDRYLLCVSGKASRAHFIHTQYTLWVTVCIGCLNKTSFCFAYSGWKE